MRIMSRFWVAILLAGAVAAAGGCSSGTTEQAPATQGAPAAGAAQAGLDRTALPIHEPSYPPVSELDARNATAPPRFELKAPAGAPNVVIVLIDDIGFGHSSAFGGPIAMPTLERLADQGLRYNRFHTTALCSPTRVALLTGHNHHANNAGAVMELATAFPGNTGVRPRSITPLAEILRQNGYSTAAFGKYHETPPWEVSTSGPVRPLADALGVRQVLRVHRRRDQPVGARHFRWRRPGRTPGVARLSLHHRHDGPGDELGERPAVADAGQALLHVFRAGRDARAAPRAEGVDCQVQGPVQRRMGQAPGGDVRAAEEAGCDPCERETDAEAKEIPAWDGMAAGQKRLFERQMETSTGPRTAPA